MSMNALPHNTSILMEESPYKPEIFCDISKYNGIPTNRLNGNVTPMLDIKASGAFASGKPTEIAAGAAMYEALAHKTPRMVAPPTESPTKFPTTTPNVPAKIGKMIANTPTIAPTFLISPQLLPAR